MNLYIRNACLWMVTATISAFFAGFTPSHGVVIFELAMCAVSYLIVACNLEGLRHEGKAQ